MQSVLGIDAGQSSIRMRWREADVGERTYSGLLTDAPVLPQIATWPASHWIGREALDAVMRAYDGRGPTTPLTDAVTATWPDLSVDGLDRAAVLNDAATRVSHRPDDRRRRRCAGDAHGRGRKVR